MAMSRSQSVRSPAGKQPYDELRRARHGELRHHDHVGLRLLLDDYFGDESLLDLANAPAHGGRPSKPPRAA